MKAEGRKNRKEEERERETKGNVCRELVEC